MTLEELLTADDIEFLQQKGWKHNVYPVGGEVHVVFCAFPIPGDAYNLANVDLLVRLPAAYPNAAPDMYWTRQDVTLKATGAFPEAAAHHEVPGSGKGAEVYNNTAWQRWSRHFHDGWRPQIDGLRSYMASVIRDLEKRR